MKKHSVLIATDLSERSDRALSRGLFLASKLNTKVTLVSVVDNALPRTLANDLVKKIREHLSATVAKEAPEVSVELLVEVGDPIMRLVEIINLSDADLVVVGRHRERNFLDWVRPSTIERIISSSAKPVLMAVSPVHGAYEKVLAPVAFSQACKHAVENARIVAPNAEFRLVHAWMAPFENLAGGKSSDLARAVERETRQKAAKWADELGFPEIELLHGSVTSGFYEEARNFDADLLAMGAHTRSLSLTLLGSFAADLVRTPPSDLLIVR